MRLFVPTTLALSLVLALACGGGGSTSPPDAAPPAPPAPAAPAPAAPAPATPAPATPAPATPAAPAAPPTAATPPAPAGPFTCCAPNRAEDILDEYLEVQVGLARDDYRTAASNLSSLRGNIMAAQKEAFDADSQKLLATLRTQTEAARDAGDLAGIRKAFPPLSETMIAFAKKHKGGGTRTVSEANCPMYPGSWLQEGTTISNPYYGKEMLTCGSFK